MASLARRAADVRITEIDLSSTIAINSNATAAFAGISAKGQLTPKFYSNFDDFVFDWGNPDASISFDHYGAMKYFEEGNSLWVTRAIGTGFRYSGLSVKNTVPGVTTATGVSGGVLDPKDPQWNSYVSVGETPLFLFTPKQGPGSYGNNIGVSILSTSLDQVTGVAATQASSGGTLGAATYNYMVAAVGRSGEALASSVATTTVASGTTNQVTITWAAVNGAIGYYVYGRSGGTLYRVTTVGATTLSFVDTGAITPDVAFTPITSTSNLPTQTGVFTLYVYDLSVSNTKPVETFTCSVKDQIDETGSQMEITQRVNPFSRYLNVQSNVYALLTTPVIKSFTTPVALLGGTSGAAPTSADINNALNVFSNKELYTIDVFMNNGRTSQIVQNNMDQLAQKRGDSVAFLDVPSTSQTAQAAVDFRNLTLNLNTSYSALFCSDLLISDPINGKMLYVPPSGAMSGLYARTSRVSQPWFSIAGLNRGLLNVLNVRNTYDDGQATLMFQSQVNYMRKFVGRGIAAWEQATLYNKSSALQFLNVRFLCNIIKRSVYDFLLYGLQEPNDEILRKQLRYGLEEFLKIIKAQRGIRDYRVVIDDTNNLPALVNSGVLAVAVIITPILAVREIQLSLVISKVGLEVSEAEIASFN